MFTTIFAILHRYRFLLSVSVCLGLFILATVTLPSRSRAQQSLPQKQRTEKWRGSFVPGEILVRYRSGMAPRGRTVATHITTRDGASLAMQVEEFAGSRVVDGLRFARVQSDKTLEAIGALRRQREVLYAEPNYLLRTTANPNDTHFLLEQYGPQKIGAPLAWDTKTGSTGTDRVVVAVIDQGIDLDHQDLNANRWINPAEVPGNGVDDDLNGVVDDVNGFNFVDNNATIFSGADTEFHGTHVAGIVGAVGNNNLGVAGVNWSVGLMSLKVLNIFGGGNTADAIEAVEYALMMRQLWESTSKAKGANIKVINASFGAAEFSDSFQDTIDGLSAAGILMVSSAGNLANGARELNNDLVPQFPADYDSPNMISVAYTDENDDLPQFSHFGPT